MPPKRRQSRSIVRSRERPRDLPYRQRLTAMRLLQAIGGAKFGGAEAFFIRLVIALHRAGQDQLVLIRDPDHAARLRAAGVAAEELRFGNSWLDGETRRRFRDAVER